MIKQEENMDTTVLLKDNHNHNLGDENNNNVNGTTITDKKNKDMKTNNIKINSSDFHPVIISLPPSTQSPNAKKRRIIFKCSEPKKAIDPLLEKLTLQNKLLQPYQPSDAFTSSVMESLVEWQSLLTINGITKFSLSLTNLITTHYPCETPTLLDHLIVAFMKTNPFLCEVFVLPLINKILAKPHVYSKMAPPFYTLIYLFDHRLQVDHSSENLCFNILQLLTTHNPIQPLNTTLTPFISDCLLSCSISLREKYFQMLITKIDNPNFSSQLDSLFEYERSKSQTSPPHNKCITPLLLKFKYRNIDHYQENFVHFIMNNKSHTISDLFHSFVTLNALHKNAIAKPFLDFLVGFISLNLSKQNSIVLFTPQWFIDCFICPTFKGIQDGLPFTSQILHTLVSNATISSFLFSRQDRLYGKHSLFLFFDTLQEYDAGTLKTVAKVLEDLWCKNDTELSWHILVQLLALFCKISNKVHKEIEGLVVPVLNSYLNSKGERISECLSDLLTFLFAHVKNERIEVLLVEFWKCLATYETKSTLWQRIGENFLSVIQTCVESEIASLSLNSQHSIISQQKLNSETPFNSRDCVLFLLDTLKNVQVGDSVKHLVVKVVKKCPQITDLLKHHEEVGLISLLLEVENSGNADPFWTKETLTNLTVSISKQATIFSHGCQLLSLICQNHKSISQELLVPLLWSQLIDNNNTSKTSNINISHNTQTQTISILEDVLIIFPEQIKWIVDQIDYLFSSTTPPKHTLHSNLLKVLFKIYTFSTTSIPSHILKIALQDNPANSSDEIKHIQIKFLSQMLHPTRTKEETEILTPKLGFVVDCLFSSNRNIKELSQVFLIKYSQSFGARESMLHYLQSRLLLCTQTIQSLILRQTLLLL